MQLISPPLVNGYQPATYRERGLAASFTSPKLAGARVRAVRDAASLPADARAEGQCLEVIVPNWVDRRGIYVAPWAAARELFRPTVHDACLGEALGRFVRDGGDLGPSELRRIARGVGQGGFAGRATAAASAEASSRTALLDETSLDSLLRELSRQRGLVASAGASHSAIVARLAHSMEWPEAELPAVLARAASHFADIGIGPGGAQAPLPTLVARIRELQRGIERNGASDPLPRGIGAGARSWAHLDHNARLIVTVAEKAIAIARGRFADLPELFAATRSDPDGTMEELQRPAWILDGWEAITLRWSLAAAAGESAAGSAAAADIEALVPALPDELDRWMQFPTGTALKATKSSRPARAPEIDPFPLDRIARNEHVLGLAA